MIVFTKGGFDPPRTRRVWLQVEEDVGPHESDKTVQVRKEGYFRLEMEPVTPPDLRTRLADGTEVFIPQETLTRASGVASLSAELDMSNSWWSPLLDGWGLDDFPDEFTFGNGVGTTEIRKGTGETTLVNWCVFPLGVQLTEAQLYRAQEIFEGIPPGNSERNVWRQFDAQGRRIEEGT